MMINNYAFNLNKNVHKPNVRNGGNSTGNTRKVTDTRNIEHQFSRYKIPKIPNCGQNADYTISNTNQVKRLVKSRKED